MKHSCFQASYTNAKTVCACIA